MAARVEVLADVKPVLGEGPLWDAETERLHWLDIAQGRIFSCRADGSELRTWDVGEKVGSIALTVDGSAFIASLKSGLHRVDRESGAKELLVDPEPDRPGNRLNDGKVDRQGRFVFGTMDDAEQETTGSLYSYDSRGNLKVLERGLGTPNGPCFSPDGTILYVSDTPTGEIWAYDYDPETGDVSSRRTFAAADESLGGSPDGATVDAEGCVWKSRVFGGKVVRYTPEGQIDGIVELPVLKVTSLNFGGPDMDTLFVTSMGRPPQPDKPEDGQLRGAVFAVTGLGVTGIPEPRFGG
ncbi:sugar lactone lactonase YvrE [Brevibacterium sanguinis]|uniref:Sugar lactone lactonase YvrE n=2 Tax=Brevibacterium TaxID=1696 RepID=A0A366IJ24_9MICO|nr:MULTISPECIES: SMP-30/gluconolactonase/LRE family protein [Brevibacterium]RBP65475.1 sugar lactone lactonase YvrE [Brevibacterium sanguinis]RBP72109.1 sugar lactone lactonase YvrE [Brevibacterium celere]